MLYVADIAMVIFQLEVKPGSLVLESGTGSGSLTTALARAVSPTGRVVSFEFNETRVGLARQDFVDIGIDHVVSVNHRDVEENGFPADFSGKADAVFLDLPRPWKVVESAANSLRADGMFCGFSPCIEQVQRTCEQLNYHGFKDIQTIEILLREYQVGRKNLQSAIDLIYHQDERATVAKESDGVEEPRNKKAKTDDSDANPIPIGYRKGWDIVGNPLGQAKGHTGYLTFARKAVDYKKLKHVDKSQAST